MIILRQKLYFKYEDVHPFFRPEARNMRKLAVKDYRTSMSALDQVTKGGKVGILKKLKLGENKNNLLKEISKSTGPERDKLISKYRGIVTRGVDQISKESKELLRTNK